MSVSRDHRIERVGTTSVSLTIRSSEDGTIQVPTKYEKYFWSNNRALPDMSELLEFSGWQYILNLMTLRKGTETRVNETKKEDITRGLRAVFLRQSGVVGEGNEKRP